MSKHALMTLRFTALATLCAATAGCFHVASAVMTPLMEASLTPEGVGISTSTWRGRSCSDLDGNRASMVELQQRYAAAGDSTTAKTTGWQVNAIDQVRSEQGCLGGTPSVASTGQVTAYGYCFASTDKANYLTPSFTYQDFYADGGAAETAAFNAMLRANYGMTQDWGGCLMEDSPAKVAAAIEKKASLTTMIVDWETVRLSWIPPVIQKAPKAAATAAAAPSSTTSTTASTASAEVQALGLNLESPSAELIGALGLKSSAGAWVVSVTPGSPAAKAGLKPMDVILDVSGQEVRGPGDVQAIASRLRGGYRAPLGIWRNRAAQNLSLEIPASLASSTTAVAAQAPTLQAAATPVVAAPPPPPQSNTFCHAYLYVVKKPGGVQSEIFQSASPELTGAGMIPTLSAFVSKVRQLYPNDWRPFTFADTQCSPTGYCYGSGENPLFGGRQMAGQFCFATREEAQKHYDEFNSVKPVYETVQLKP
ncbi:S1C family serine protease [Pseudomonas sp. 5P_5.1_Bac1]|uniref:S1C family serine protease n=1 Tax=Pseudomonas sp. 5P_5.1_Bac1 TaxID=2971616 RepID=UPI0021C7B426|nr:PDZ domain-containing protein [Pseudomonas sp. 5P_5.1_Bac1]MCU1724876.1 PDZ domain-containing protein [Pseudomonas sp. 5P_5.1_Bac1]